MAEKVDIPGIKSAIKIMLEDRNSDGSSPIDLSDGMSKRVKKVATYNPEKINPHDANLYPFVTVYFDSKKPINKTVAVNQLVAKREAELTFQVVGMVWNQNFTTAEIYSDPADNDIENLMENIELILRADSTLGGTVLSHTVSGITYHSSPLDEQTHMRVGFLEITAKIFY